ncbi:MAG: F0F1 ATP synthase subunit B [Lentisphaerae bacterium]|nr:F0F1 ATP synthase subunit B [Lentisphaerota bacterium]
MDGMHFDAGLFVWTLITFGILFGLLARFALRPIRRLMQEREDSIRSALDGAAKARDEAEKMRAESEERIAAAREDVRKIIEDGERIAANMRKEAARAAAGDAARLVEEARADIEKETRRGLDELKGVVANLSLRVSRQILRDELSPERHAELADQFIERLKKTHGN